MTQWAKELAVMVLTSFSRKIRYSVIFQSWNTQPFSWNEWDYSVNLVSAHWRFVHFLRLLSDNVTTDSVAYLLNIILYLYDLTYEKKLLECVPWKNCNGANGDPVRNPGF